MTGEELTEVQRESRMSDRAFLEWLAISVTSASRRRLRRWKLGDLEIPPPIAKQVRSVFREELEAIAARSVDRQA